MSMTHEERKAQGWKLFFGLYNYDENKWHEEPYKDIKSIFATAQLAAESDFATPGWIPRPIWKRTKKAAPTVESAIALFVEHGKVTLPPVSLESLTRAWEWMKDSPERRALGAFAMAAVKAQDARQRAAAPAPEPAVEARTAEAQPGE